MRSFVVASESPGRPSSRETPDPQGETRLVGDSLAILGVRALIQRIAPTDRPVMIHGPTGCGKDLAAQEIHRLGGAPGEPFVELNCSAIPEQLLEAELFGHERGAFTGALASRAGHLERTGAGTLFLDEIGDLPLALQPKLLRVLESRQFQPVGGAQVHRFRGRFVAATHRDLAEMVRAGSFREDLYYRLNVFVIDIPPLEQRREDIPRLCRHFASRQSRPMVFSPEALEILTRAAWPGNVRQLRNLVDRLAVLSDDPVITPGLLGPFLESPVRSQAEAVEELLEQVLCLDADDKLSALEHLLVDKALRDCGGNKTAAARRLGVNRKVVERRSSASGICDGHRAGQEPVP